MATATALGKMTSLSRDVLNCLVPSTVLWVDSDQILIQNRHCLWTARCIYMCVVYFFLRIYTDVCRIFTSIANFCRCTYCASGVVVRMWLFKCTCYWHISHSSGLQGHRATIFSGVQFVCCMGSHCMCWRCCCCQPVFVVELSYFCQDHVSCPVVWQQVQSCYVVAIIPCG